VLAAADLNDTFGAKLDLAGGKVLQVVRATDTTNRSTTSAALVDASLSVTITPQKSDSAILVLWNVWGSYSGATAISRGFQLAVTDNSNNTLLGGYGLVLTVATGLNCRQTIIGYSTPGTISATTYKARFAGDGSGGGTTALLRNADSSGDLYAIEVSA